MKIPALIGMALIIVGMVEVIYGGFTYTTREDVVQVGPIEVAAKTKRTLPLLPVAGGVAIASGIALIILGGRKV